MRAITQASPERAPEKVGGVPVAAAPSSRGGNRRTSALATTGGHGTPHGSGVTSVGGEQPATLLRAAALLLPLALAACTPRQGEAHQVLRAYGFDPVSITATDWWFGPCQWTEPYTARFLVRTRKGLEDGVLCATVASAEGAKLRHIRRIDRERASELLLGVR